MRTFNTGATRDSDEGKPDYAGFLSPLVMKRFGEYMLLHQKQADGRMRASDNWKHGIPKDTYIKSGWRHFHDWWMAHEGYESREGIEDALMALLFNVQGYAHELLLERGYGNPLSEAEQACSDMVRDLVEILSRYDQGDDK